MQQQINIILIYVFFMSVLVSWEVSFNVYFSFGHDDINE